MNFNLFQIWIQLSFCQIIANTKGQLISKAIYGLVTSPKKQTDEFDLFLVKSKEANKTNPSVCFLVEVTRP